MANVSCSIIIPEYNAQHTVERCVSSVLKQDLKSIEVIIVDDGSVDISPQVLDEYSASHQQIYVVHQINHGVSFSRNIGIKLSESNYIGFVDSDDTVTDQMYSKMVSFAVNNDLDCVMCGYKAQYPWGEKRGICEIL